MGYGGRQFLSVRGQTQGHDAPVLGPLFSLEESFGLQRRDGVADGGLGEAEFPGELAHTPELYVVMEQVDQELGLYGAEVVPARLFPESHAEDLREPFERGDYSGVYVLVLRGGIEDRPQARSPHPLRTAGSTTSPEGPRT